MYPINIRYVIKLNNLTNYNCNTNGNDVFTRQHFFTAEHNVTYKSTPKSVNLITKKVRKYNKDNS